MRSENAKAGRSLCEEGALLADEGAANFCSVCSGEEVVKNVEDCEYSWLYAAASDHFKNIYSNPLNPDSTPHQHLLVKDQEEALLHMIRLQDSDTFLSKLALQREPIHEFPPIILPKKPVKDKKSGMNNRKAGSADVTQQTLDTRLPVPPFKRKISQSLSQVLPTPHPSRRGVERAAQMYCEMLNTHQTHPWSSLTHVAIAVAPQVVSLFTYQYV